MSSRYNKRRKSKRPLEETLLNEGERAALRAIRSDEYDNEREEEDDIIHCSPSICLERGIVLCCNGAAFSLLIMMIIFIIGLTLFSVSHPPILSSTNITKTSTPVILRHVSSFIMYGGLFGLLSGLSNLFVLILLFFKVPLLYGSGVFKRKHRQISDILRKVVMQMLFDSERLERYFIERINQYSINNNIIEGITKAMKSPKAERIIEDHLTELYAGPEAYYLLKLGVTREKLKPMIGPAILSLCAETGPTVLGEFLNRDSSTSSVPEIREAMDNYLRHRVNDLTGQNISSYMKKIMFRHLSGLIVFGTIAGFVIGLIAQALRFTINPEFIIDSVIV